MNISARLATYFLSSAALGAVGALAAQPMLPSALPTDQQAVVDPNLQLVAGSAVLHDGSFVGGTYDAYYGKVQIQATVRGGSVVGVKALKFPNRSGTSRSINRQALPYLLQEVVAKQSARIDIISGASLTSRAYIKSLRDALKLSAQ
jgi:uncharacterized protein with FMN-binding domain